MAISKKMIIKSKNNVLKTLVKHFNATQEEISVFETLVENEDRENWTCGFEDELVPLFRQIRRLDKTKDSLDSFFKSGKHYS